jgi:sterol desaturase/sphingolipid hydroxylase (fatty acid hydroxylase superfamily)
LVSIGLGFVAGLVAWTFLEYVIHFWLGHLPKGRILISSEHLHHHADILYFTPLRLKVRGAVPVLSTLLIIASALFGLAVGLGFVAAVAVGWTTYEWLHQSIHVNGPTNWYSRWAARHHLSHHFTRPNRNHGVTTPIWDIILRTYEPTPRVRVGRRHVANVPWMAAGLEAGPARPPFMADYDLA